MLNCNGCKNKNTYKCEVCVGWDKYESDILIKPTLAVDISCEMKQLWEAKKLAVSAAKTFNDMSTKFNIKKVIFNYPATIVIWADGTKTIVKSGDHDVFDPEKGLAMAIAKKALGNQGNYYEVFKKWLPEEKYDKPIEPVVKNVKATNIGEDGILVEGELTKVRLLTPEELAEKLGCSKATVQRQCREGKYPGAVKVGGKWKIPYTEN